MNDIWYKCKSKRFFTYKTRNPLIDGEHILLFAGIYKDFIFNIGIETWIESKTLGWVLKLKLIKFELSFSIRLLKRP